MATSIRAYCLTFLLPIAVITLTACSGGGARIAIYLECDRHDASISESSDPVDKYDLWVSFDPALLNDGLFTAGGRHVDYNYAYCMAQLDGVKIDDIDSDDPKEVAARAARPNDVPQFIEPAEITITCNDKPTVYMNNFVSGETAHQALDASRRLGTTDSNLEFHYTELAGFRDLNVTLWSPVGSLRLSYVDCSAHGQLRDDARGRK